MKKVLVLLALVAAGAAAHAGEATVKLRGWVPTADGPFYNQHEVSYQPVTAGDAKEASLLLTRLNEEAQKLCTYGKVAQSKQYADKIAACKADVVGRAVREIGSSDLSAAAGAK